MEPDYILNGVASGDIADRLLANNMDANLLRPWIGVDGKTYFTVMRKNAKGVIVPVNIAANANATLLKDEWISLDQAVIKVAKERTRLVADLVSSGLTYTIPEGLGATVLQYQDMSDITDAAMSMDGLTPTEQDRPEYALKNLPLPLIAKDFSFSAREIETARRGRMPLDTTGAELATSRVIEYAEKLLLGVLPTYTFGGGTIYGYTNYTGRLTKVMTLPTAVGWTPNTLLTEVLAMRQQSVDAFHRGPWRLYTSPNWDKYLDEDFSASKGDNTLRERLLKIQGINAIDTSDFLTGYQMILVQQTSNVVREVLALSLTTVQWDSMGGLKKNFKVMASMTPQLRSDHNGNTGIVHGTAS